MDSRPKGSFPEILLLVEIRTEVECGAARLVIGIESALAFCVPKLSKTAAERKGKVSMTVKVKPQVRRFRRAFDNEKGSEKWKGNKPDDAGETEGRERKEETAGEGVFYSPEVAIYTEP